MNRLRLAAIATAGALALALGIVSPAAATDTVPPSVSSNDSRATLIASPSATSFGIEDTLRFLVLGDGPVADANPGLAEALGFVPFPADGDRAAADALIASYIAADPRTAAQVTKAVQSGNPARVDAGLALFAETFNQYVIDLYEDASEQLEPGGPDMQPMWAWTETWALAVTVVAGGAWAVVFGAVAGFHVGAAVTVIVVVYLPGMEGGYSTLERDNLVSQISTALG